MAEIIKARVWQKVDTEANWNANPLILGPGEQAFVVNSAGLPINFKVGDGMKRFSELSWSIQYAGGQYIQLVGNALPAPTVDAGYSLVGPGTYTFPGQANIVAPVGRLSQLLWGGTSWSLVDMGELPQAENKIPDWVAGTYTIGNQRILKDQIWEVNVPNTSQVPGTGTDWVAKTPKKSTPFFTADSDLTGYNLGTIVDFGNWAYNGSDDIYLSFIRSDNPLVQVINDSDVVVAQYYPNAGGVATGIEQIDILSLINPHPVLFKAIVNWGAIGDTVDFGKNLKIVKEINFINNIKDDFGNIYEKTAVDNKDNQVGLLSIFDTVPENIPVNYDLGTILDYSIDQNYVDNGDKLYLTLIQNPRPVVQVINQDDELIAQYFDDRPSFYETGIKSVSLTTIAYPYIEMFKVRLNWDKLDGTIDFGKTLPLNPKKLLIDKEYIDERIDDVEIQVDRRLDDVLNKNEILEEYINLFDKNDPDILYGMWVPSTSTTGNPEELGSGTFMTGFIPVSEGDKVYTTTGLGKWGAGFFAVFDENKEIITKSDIISPSFADGYAYTVLPGEHYIREAFRDVPGGFPLSDMEVMMITVNQYTTEEYIPFGYKDRVDPSKIDFPNTRKGKIIAWFGDSFIEFGNMPEIMQNMTGARVFNLGIGGSRVAQHTSSPADYDAFSMYNLADAIVTGDWSRQIASAIYLRDNEGDDNVAIVERMVNIDYSKVDILIASFGTNDFTGNNSIGDTLDNDGSTIMGATNYSIQRILTAFPNMRIVFTTPLYRKIGGMSGESSDEYQNSNGDKLINIIEAIEEVCKLNHVDCLTLYNKAGVNKFNFDSFTVDGTHPNQAGNDRYGDMFARYINSN